jgi:imidazolonepropionase-like amidohydrolase
VPAVRERAERHVDVVEVMARGGMMTAGTDVFVPQFSIEELRLLVEQSHAAGLPVTAHAHAAAAVDQAVAVGVDGIEHDIPGSFGGRARSRRAARHMPPMSSWRPWPRAVSR